jgi:hypothetical protein
MSQDEYVRTALRVPPDLHRALHDAADAAGHSFNAEIIGRLQGSFGPAQSPEGTAAQQLADSRAQTIIAMAFLQGSLCETVQAMFSALSPSHQRDRTFKEATQLAASLLVAAKPGDYLLTGPEIALKKPALARFLKDLTSDAAAHERKEARAGKTGSSKG